MNYFRFIKIVYILHTLIILYLDELYLTPLHIILVGYQDHLKKNDN